MHPILPFFAVCLLGACVEPEPEPHSPYELPPYGGCTATQDGTATGGDLYTWTYDEAEALARYSAEFGWLSYEETWARDSDGCLTAYTKTTIDDDKTIRLTHDYVCQDGFPISSASTSIWDDGDPALNTYTYTNTVEAGHLVLQTVHINGRGVHREASSWTDGLLTTTDSWSEQYWWQHIAWTHDGDGRIVTLAQETPYVATENLLFTYERDEHGRTTRLEHHKGESPKISIYVETTTWFDDIYETSRVERDYSADGKVELVYDWDCDGDWPWSCTVQVDMALDEDELLDGEPDDVWEYSWSCP